MKITVTQENIDNGCSGSLSSCAVALACKAAGLGDVTVDTQFIKIRNDLVFVQYKLPTEVGNFISDYDAGRPVKPIVFDLTLVSGAI